MAADLTLAGHTVHLLELPEFRSNLDAVMARGGIAISGVARTGNAMPAVVTTDPARAVERQAVGAALGMPDLVPVPGWLRRYYGASGETTYEAIHTCPAYMNFVWPVATAIRYVDEDAPYALVPLASIADELKMPASVTRSLVDLCGAALGRDYWSQGPRAGDLGLRGMRPDEITRLVEGGER